MSTLLKDDITANIGTELYYVEVKWRNGILIMDEPATANGKDKGPDPYTTLLASLAGCTLSTLRMYIDRKGWNIPEISIVLNMEQQQESNTTFIKRIIRFSSEVSNEQKEKLLLIAKKCPVSKILENNILINTSI